MKDLIERIEKYQEDKGISDIRLTTILGVHPTTWYYIKAGKRNPGMKFLRAVERELPELTKRNKILRFLKTLKF